MTSNDLQIVDFVNDNGVVFDNRRIINIRLVDGMTRYDVEPTDCPWYPKHRRNLMRRCFDHPLFGLF